MVSFPILRDDHYDLGLRTFVIGFTASLLCIPFAFGCVSAFQFGTIDSSSRSLVREIEVVRLLGTMKQLTQELRALDHLAHGQGGHVPGAGSPHRHVDRLASF